MRRRRPAPRRHRQSRSHGLLRRALCLASATGLVGAAAVVGAAAPASAASPGPAFKCQPGFYQVISGQLAILDPATTPNSYQNIGPANAYNYNAIGFDSVDDYIYGISTLASPQTGAPAGDLVQVASDGSVTDLGSVANLPTAKNIVSGDFATSTDPNAPLGDLVVDDAGQYFSINIATRTATMIPTTQSVPTFDMVNINGTVYSLQNGMLYTVNLSTGATSAKSVSGVPTNSTFGAGWSDQEDDLYFSLNNNGSIYEVSDPDGASPSATVAHMGASTNNNDGASCKVTDSTYNDPTAKPDTYTVPSGSTTTVDANDGVLSNDVGTNLTVPSSSSYTQPAHGSVTVGTDGGFTYTPDPGYSGSDSFSYTATDQFGRTTQPAAVTLTVTAPPSPTVAANGDNYSTAQNTTLTVAAPGVLGNDTGNGITVTGNSNPSHGTVTVNSDGSFSYVPTQGYTGSDSFTYTITGSNGQMSTATVNLTVTPPAPPTAQNDTYYVPANGSLPISVQNGVLANDTGSGITVTSNTNPSQGTVAVNGNGSFTYTPTSGYSGPDTWTYTITDSAGQHSTATVTMHVTPVSTADSYSTTAGTSLTVPAAQGVLSNDAGSGLMAAIQNGPTHGTVMLNPDGSFTYNPVGTFTGTDSFTYVATDKSGQSTSPTTVTIGVSQPPPPTPPTAQNDDYYVAAGGTRAVSAHNGVLANDTGTNITVQSNSQPSDASSTVSVDPTTGAFTYVPNAGFSGTDTFQYIIVDSAGQTSTATVTMHVTPVSTADTYGATADTPLQVDAGDGVLSNDQGSVLTAALGSQADHGTVALKPDGSFTYTPNAGYSGPDSFTYVATDSSGQQTSPTAVTLSVAPVAPAAKDDNYSVTAGTPLSVAAPGVLGNDTGTGISVTSHTAPSNGTVSIASNGSFTYTPTTGYTGADSFTYTITGANNQTSTATVSLTVAAPGSGGGGGSGPSAAPVANPDSYGVTSGQTLSVPVATGVLTNDTGTSITVTSHTAPSHGTVTVNGDGSFSYTPTAGYSGPDSFTYTITDASGQTSTATVSLTVSPALKAVDDHYRVTAGHTLTVPAPGVLGNDTGTSITVTSHTPPSHGTVSINPDGSFSYTPTAGYSGPDSFTYTITDSAGQTSTATVSLTVVPASGSNGGSGGSGSGSGSGNGGSSGGGSGSGNGSGSGGGHGSGSGGSGSGSGGTGGSGGSTGPGNTGSGSSGGTAGQPGSPASGTTLPFTGLDAVSLGSMAALLIGAGMILVGLGGRRSRRWQ